MKIKMKFLLKFTLVVSIFLSSCVNKFDFRLPPDLFNRNFSILPDSYHYAKGNVKRIDVTIMEYNMKENRQGHTSYDIYEFDKDGNLVYEKSRFPDMEGMMVIEEYFTFKNNKLIKEKVFVNSELNEEIIYTWEKNNVKYIDDSEVQRNIEWEKTGNKITINDNFRYFGYFYDNKYEIVFEKNKVLSITKYDESYKTRSKGFGPPEVEYFTYDNKNQLTEYKYEHQVSNYVTIDHYYYDGDVLNYVKNNSSPPRITKVLKSDKHGNWLEMETGTEGHYIKTIITRKIEYF